MADDVKRPAHRPALPEPDQALILGSLLILEKGSAEFRRMRRKLAVDMDRTERAIEIVFEKLKLKHAGKIGHEAISANLPTEGT